MACRRFAGRSLGAGVTSIEKIAVAMVAMAAAASLSGCMTVAGSVQEQLWFDHAQGYEIHHVSPEIRFRGGIGYPRTDFRAYRRPPLEIDEP